VPSYDLLFEYGFICFFVASPPRSKKATMDPIEFYRQHIQQLEAMAEKHTKNIKNKAFLRFLFFTVSAICAYWCATAFSLISCIALFFGFSLFIMAIILQNKAKTKLEQIGELIKINRDELKAINGDCSAFENGNEFTDPEHSYSFDLDLFGQSSIFQLICRCTSVSGKKKLAEWLNKCEDNSSEITNKQEAIKELSGKIEWTQAFRFLILKSNEEKFNAFADWIGYKNKLSSGKLFTFLLKLLPAVCLLLLMASLIFPLWNYFFIAFVINAAVIYRSKSIIFDYTRFTTDAEKFLAEYNKAFEYIEQSSFTSEKLQALQAKLKHKDENISKITAKLAKTISLFEQRNNAAIYFPVNILLLADLHLIKQFEKWRADYGNEIFMWIETLAEFESLISFGTLHFNNNDWTFPKLSEKGEITIIDAGHPLIDKTKRVMNDFKQDSQPYFMLVTGSNMAGKSSYLRTVGINLVLAMNGCPVCASQMQFSPVKIFSSMRIMDSLTDSISSFYAELRRIKRITQMAKSEKNCFFLLDEMLRGTNSHDRHIGAKSLLVQLIADNACGLVATHDVQLGELENRLAPALENFSFDVQIKEKELFFDYKIKRGTCTSLNASLLMEEAGIKLEKE